MATANAPSTKSGTWLVIGLLAFATVLVLISRLYRVPPQDDVHEVLKQEGMPAVRQGITLSQEGKKLLPVEEQREMDTIYAEALKALSAEERQRFMTLAQKGAAATDREITENAELMQKALNALPMEKRTRLWALVEKAVQLQLAQQKSAAAQGQQ